MFLPMDPKDVTELIAKLRMNPFYANQYMMMQPVGQQMEYSPLLEIRKIIENLLRGNK